MKPARRGLVHLGDTQQTSGLVSAAPKVTKKFKLKGSN